MPEKPSEIDPASFERRRLPLVALERPRAGCIHLWHLDLAHLASNPEGYIGDNPPLPDPVKDAIKSVRFSATLLIEPGRNSTYNFTPVDRFVDTRPGGATP